jgi:hypothetical protein
MRALLVTLAAAVAIQFIPYGRDHFNPPVTAEPKWDNPVTRAQATRACFDCHSNQTVWPLYSHVAPLSWLLQHDVQEGRAAMNFSEWDRPQAHAKDAPREVRENGMPPLSYRLMHSGGRLTAREREELAQGLQRTLAAAPK